VTEVRDRLDHMFRLLVGSRRGLERHQTLRHAVQWSHNLLADPEKTLLNRCSVFAGGFDLDAAHEIAGAGDDFTTLDRLDALQREYRENDLFPPSDITEDWLKLTDFEPGNVVRLAPYRQSDRPAEGSSTI